MYTHTHTEVCTYIYLCVFNMEQYRDVLKYTFLKHYQHF